MTFDEIAHQLDELTLDEKLWLMEILSEKICKRVREHYSEQLNSNLVATEPASSDK